MSEAQKRYLEKINATYAANVAFFQEKMPSVHEVIMKGAGIAAISTMIDADLVIELRINNNPLPLAELLQMTHDAMRIFDSNDRVMIAGRTRNTLPNEPVDRNLPDDDYMGNYLMTFIDTDCRNDLDDMFVRACGRDRAGHVPDFGPKVVPILIVFGSGYGSHLTQLLDRYLVRHLIVIDNDPGITRLSLGFTDYIALYNDHLRQKGTYFTLISSTDPQDIVNQLDQTLSQFWPPYFIHGISVFHNLRNTELALKIEETLAEKLWLFYRGWGWFDDEYLSIRHSLVNVARGHKLFSPQKAVDPDAVAFVVANGPSLDGLVDVIRANRDKAIVVSCGSALGSLYRYGIKPDFHVEIERPYSTYEALVNTVPKEYLAGIRLVGPTTVPPDAFDLAGEALMFTKMSDSAGSTLPGEFTRVATFPSVSNGAVSWLLRMGFQNLVLIGTDMGARDPEKHHSSQSLYFNTDDLPDGYQEYAKVEAQKNVDGMTMEAPANFGGTVRTNDFLTLGRMRLEMEFAGFSKVQVINLNDGALIKGAQPVRREDFVFPDGAFPREQAVEQVLAAFRHIDGLGAEDMLAKLRNGVDAAYAGVKPHLDADCTTKLEVMVCLVGIYKAIENLVREHPAATWTLRGSMLHLCRRVYDYVTSIPAEAEAVAFAKESFGRIDTFLQGVIAELATIDVNAPVPLVKAQTRNATKG